jgi:hypothetical protein
MIVKTFDVEGVEYYIDEFGVIHQTDQTITQVYDKNYVAQRYDSLPDHGHQMSMLRIGYLIGTLTSFHSVLDVGYGNGDFLATLKSVKWWDLDCWGYDISDYPIPEGCQKASFDDLFKPWNVITFFDSFEHIADLSFVKKLTAWNLVFTVPNCCYDKYGIDWFRSWKHRRPGEHLHHFNSASLTAFMRDNGYMFRAYNYLEDVIRKSDDAYPNIVTVVFRKML